MPFITGFENFVRTNEPLAPLTWFKLGGNAEYLAEPNSVDELRALVVRAREEEVPVRMLGGGSNVLVRNHTVPGVVVRLTSPVFSEMQIDKSRTKVTVGGGAKLGHVISVTVREGLAGLETLVGIPGTIGGALHGNAGSRGGDIGQWTSKATLMTSAGEIFERSRAELVFAYRESSLDELVILGAEFELDEDNPEELTKRMQKQWIVKKAAQPLDHQSAGCIFKNPRGMSAGMLIDQLNLKGRKVGGAEVSDRHANFIVAHEGATSDDILKLIDEVREQVHERLGIELELEIKVW
jgi:UDP-N-acetylmuramate dehydrogenase